MTTPRLTIDLIARCHNVAKQTGARINVTEDLPAALNGVDYVYTDVWVSMGEPESVWEERISQLSAYQVNREALQMTGNPSVKFMHCLPAFHNRETEIGEKIYQRYGIEAWKSPRTCSSPMRRSCSPRPRIACIRSRPSW